jgi:hypothetical protein
MSRALDQFGDSLVRASEELHRAGGSRTRVSRGRAAIGDQHAGWVARAARRLRRRPVRVLAGVAVIGALGAAGSTLLGPQGDPRAILSIECGGTVTGSATGNPVSDCAALWPSLYHEPAPRLVAWVAASGGAVVVAPAGAPPVGAKVLHWRRLPAGWTQDRAAVLLAHQLEDVATGLQGRSCWSAGSAVALVRAALAADGLASWRVEVRRQSGEGGGPTCLTVAPIVQADGRTVAVVERPVRAPAHGSFRTPASAAQLAMVASVERRVNLEISAGKPTCAGISRAAALWRTRIQQAGLPTDRYVVIAWPHAPVSGGCAHVYVTAPGGGGPYEVYVAG